MEKNLLLEYENLKNKRIFQIVIKMVIDKEKSHFKAPTTKIDKLIKEWREFVNSCKAGYELSFYDYKNDLDIWLLIQKIIDSNTKKSEKISMAVLFGSYAKGIAHKESDIDIYIDTTDARVKKEVELVDSKINIKTGRYDKNSLLIKEVDKNHVIIKGVESYYEKNKFFDETS